MANIQEAAINESTAPTDDQVHLTLPALQNQVQQDFVSSEHFELSLCCYVNATNFLQMARSANISNWHFERVVFPGERLLFEASPEAQLEIHTGITSSAIITDRISCKHLRVSLQ